MYDRQGAAEKLSFSVDTIDRLIAKGKANGLWPVYQIAGRPRIPEKAIIRLLTQTRIK